MSMPATAMAMMVLFAGRDLDGWVTISGRWALSDGAMVCRAAPASIRSTWESDHFTLSFKYRHGERGLNRVFVHSKMTTGGPGLMLSPTGGIAATGFPTRTRERPTRRSATTSSGNASGPAGPARGIATPVGEWISVEMEVRPGQLQAEASRADGTVINHIQQAIDKRGRGFVRFEATEPGLEIRDVVVREPGFTLMFDGETLDGWEIMYPKDPDDPGWVIERGIVKCRGRRSSWLRTLRTYDNFVLRLEYQLPPRGNSGIFLRAPIVGRVSRIGLEIQLLDDVPHRGRIKPAQHTGSIYDGIAPEIQVPAPVNQWNGIEVLLDGRHIRTTLNGIELYDADLRDAAKDTSSHRRPLATRQTVGFIGLQDHSTVVKFRNVRIRELP